MKDFLLNNLDIIVTIIGFVITYQMTTKSVSDEIRKSKIAHNVEVIHPLLLELCNMMSKIQKSAGKKNAVSLHEYEMLMTKIFAYGSKGVGGACKQFRIFHVGGRRYDGAVSSAYRRKHELCINKSFDVIVYFQRERKP